MRLSFPLKNPSFENSVTHNLMFLETYFNFENNFSTELLLERYKFGSLNTAQDVYCFLDVELNDKFKNKKVNIALLGIIYLIPILLLFKAYPIQVHLIAAIDYCHCEIYILIENNSNFHPTLQPKLLDIIQHNHSSAHIRQALLLF